MHATKCATLVLDWFTDCMFPHPGATGGSGEVRDYERVTPGYF